MPQQESPRESQPGYRIYGAEVSPYSVKVRSYFRYKGIAHQWLEGRGEEAKPYQKLPLIPVVVSPEGEGMQDSTPVLDAMEARHPQPSIHPPDDAPAFVSALLEEFGDEWGNKWMFHYRWARPADQQSAAARIVRAHMPGLTAEQYAPMEAAIVKRMVPRVWFVGSNEQTAPQIEAGFHEIIAQLEAHLSARPYLFGARPAFGDFGLWGQIYNAWTDPTCKAIVETEGPQVVRWIKRMLQPEALGGFEDWNSLQSTLLPLLREQVGGLFLPWSIANAECIAAGGAEFTVQLRSGAWTQKPQKYHARSLKALRARYAAVANKNALDQILKAADCYDALQTR